MQRRFFVALGLATALPLVGIPLLNATGAASLATPSALLTMLTTFSGAHILASLWFGADQAYTPSMRARPWRMYASFLLIPLALLAATLTSATLTSILFALYTAWLAHHYSRQNYGILAFAAARDGVGKLPAGVNLIVNLTTLAGAAGMVTWVGTYRVGPALDFLVSGPVIGAAMVVSITAFVAAAVLIGRLLIVEPQLRRAPTVLAFLGLTWAFFLPVLLNGSTAINFAPYAAAHGLQYLVFMSVTAGRSRFGWKGALAMCAGVAVLGAASTLVATRWLAPIWTGLVVWHFLVDAKLWKMADPAVRAIVRQRFDFVFAGKPKAAAQSMEKLA